MILVVDANILFSALLRNSIVAELLFQYSLYAPDYLLDEFKKHKEYLILKSQRDDEEFNNVLNVFNRRITFVSLEEIRPFIEEATIISPDPDDVPYIALALKLNCAIWSNDKALKLKQLKVRVYSTEDLIHRLHNKNI